MSRSNWRENAGAGLNSFRAIAGSAANRAREYVVQKEYRNTLEQVKSQLKGEASGSAGWRQTSSSRSKSGIVEKVQIFPGWAVRRYRAGGGGKDSDVAPFDLEISVAGYATSSRPPELATRSQKVFMQLAKRFAALPKLPTDHDPDPVPRLSQSTEDLLKMHPLPVTPADLEQKEMEELEAQLKRAELDSEADNESIRRSSPPPTPPRNVPAPPVIAGSTLDYLPNYAALPYEELKRLHANLNSRLEPFWSSLLSNRRVKLSIYATTPPNDSERGAIEKSLIDFTDSNEDPEQEGPLAVAEITTLVNGEFQDKIRIPWEKLCTHPKALYIAYGDRSPSAEHQIYVHADLVPLPVPSCSSQLYEKEIVIPTVSSTAPVTLTEARLRVISDIDDTVKKSDILGGAKLVFHNVFVSELSRLIIKDMSAWYKKMWDRGVRFHYVSNSPFELLPVINEFFQISELPAGSVKLRSYTKRSLFNGLLSGSAGRKRDNVLGVLNNFRECQFILIGDSGEQDLELYSALAKERPDQILGIFIRDVTTLSGEPLTDPIASKWQEGISDDVLHLLVNPNALDSNGQPLYFSPSYPNPMPARPNRTSSVNSIVKTNRPTIRRSTALSMAIQDTTISEEPQPIRKPSMDSPNGYSSSRDQHQREVNIVNSQLQGLPPSTRRRIELQIRLNAARDQIPPHVKLRVFKNPEECTEVEEIMYNIQL